MIRLRRFFGLVACGWLSWAGTVHVAAVTDWNQHTATAIISPVPTGAGKPAALGLEVPPTVVVLRGSPQHLRNTMKHVLLRELLGRTLSASRRTQKVWLRRFP